MAGRILITAAAAGILALSPPASAEDGSGSEQAWALFAETCRAVIAADDPARFTATEIGDEGTAGHTVDGMIAVGATAFAKPVPGVSAMSLQTTVNGFAGGRVVQCMLQLFQPDDSFTDLGEVAQARIAEDFPGLALAAGGPLDPASVIGAFSADTAGVRLQSFSSEGFPPAAMVAVQVVPSVILLTYIVSRTAAE